MTENGREVPRGGTTLLDVTLEMFPVVCLQSVGTSTEADIEQAHRKFLEAFARQRRMVCISDARLSSFDAMQRHMLGQWSKRIHALGKPYTAATIVMLEGSSLLRGVVTALNWIAPPPIPQHVVHTVDEAVETARRVCRAENLEADWSRVRAWLERSHSRAGGQR
jgi:hypothetical protein